MNTTGIFDRTQLLLGSGAMEALSKTKVIVFGVGGVGSWCAEGLVRSGIGHLTIVDSDCVAVSNVNRQLMATTATIGQVKVEVLKKRLLEINPQAEITAMQKIYSAQTAAEFHLEEYDYIVDAIDSLSNKINLIMTASAMPGRLFSSMGAALKINPQGVRVAEFWKVRGCPLGAAMRKQMKRKGLKPAKKFLCVYSEELMENHGTPITYRQEALKPETTEGDPELASHDWSASKAQINGTTVHITAIFGFTISGLIIQNLWQRLSESGISQ